MFSRRAMGRLALGSLGALSLPRAARAASSERRFLFLYCAGGWDTTRVFTPVSAGSIADPEAGAEVADINGIRFSDHPDRPSVRSYFESWGADTAVINGLEVRSVAHERCRQLLLTGNGVLGEPDWPTRIAAGGSSRALPHLVVAGPVYPGSNAASVVRVGDDGQLPDLISGAALLESDQVVAAHSAASRAAQEAYLRRRIASGAAADPGRRAFLDAYTSALDQAVEVASLGGLDLRTAPLGCERDIVGDAALAFDAFSLGATRCAMLQYDGWCAEGWDTHKSVEPQSVNFEDLFRYLSAILEDLGSRTAIDGAPLASEVTIVVVSEMGRAPQVNSWGGKDHWTFTSCLLVGAGVRGGRVVGGLDDDAYGLPVDLASGDPTDSGTHLLPEHLGATLLALADLDAGAVGDPIDAVLA